MTTALAVRHLTVKYGPDTALDNLSADFPGGHVTGLIGPNGAGKTSFIKALCGRAPCVSGEVFINGHAVKRGTSRQKLIGLVPQDIGLYGHMTARENLSAFASIMGIPKLERAAKVTHALETVDLMHKSGTRVEALSGGMKRRINVAAAIMHGPALLILDEPTAGVDLPARDAIHALAGGLAKQGMAVLLVTHELEQAEALCDKILILAAGKKLAFDAPASILSQAYAGAREVMVRFAVPPTAAVMETLSPFEFSQGELPTIWTAMTEASEVTFVSAFMTALKGGDHLIREISVRRPGLPSLMRHIERTGALPC